MNAIILLQAAPGGGGSMLGLLFPVLIVVVFYFFLMRPQVKKQRETQKFLDDLREGMEVVTNAGIIGKVTRIDGNIVRLMVDERVFIRIVKQSISGEYKPA